MKYKLFVRLALIKICVLMAVKSPQGVAGPAHPTSLGIVSVFRNEGPYLKEWIEYHRLAGVSHFLLFNHKSDDNSMEVLSPYIAEGFVVVLPADWPVGDNTPNTERQRALFKKGSHIISKKVGWVAFIDADEFIIPMHHNSICECIDDCFCDKDRLMIEWKCFGTSNIHIEPGDTILDKLLMCSDESFVRNRQVKSIIRSSYLPKRIRDVHRVETLFGASSSIVRHELRIHHYAVRDENFFWNVRIKTRMYRKKRNKKFWMEYYNETNRVENICAIEFLKRANPELAASYWKLRLTSPSPSNAEVNPFMVPIEPRSATPM